MAKKPAKRSKFANDNPNPPPRSATPAIQTVPAAVNRPNFPPRFDIHPEVRGKMPSV